MLVTATGSVQLGYDPLRRLAWTTGNPNFTHFAYDNEALIAEYDYSGNLVRRYVHGPGVDEPLVWYEGTGTSDRRWLHADERGSIVAASSASGAPIGYNAYDEYGIPASGNIGRFQYTGQQWIAELGMYHYRARIYSPTFGRFLQTDPIGYWSGMNLYAYVLNDPVNWTDPSGLGPDDPPCTTDCTGPDIEVTGPGSGPGPGPSGWIMIGTSRGWQPRTISENSQGGGGDRAEQQECTRLQRNLQEVGAAVTDVGGSVSDVGISVSGIGGLVALAGVGTGDVPMAAAGARVISFGGELIATGGGIALVGGIMQAVGGRPSDAIGSIIADRLTRNLPLPEAARTWVGDQISAGTQAILPNTNLCR